jgi:acetyl/propionyl-CoA carboxylase alpha subunit/acetyl-CoA carboxylase carboxyltransferase component
MGNQRRLLIANRGEIALRIIRTAQEYGLHTVAIYSVDDEDSLHVRRADEAIRLIGVGPAAYLDIDEITSIAVATNCQMIHPGYGFLSESSTFVRSIENTGVVFVGPTPEQMELFGNKSAACNYARKKGVPVLGSSSVLNSCDEFIELFENARPRKAHIIKAVSGGGGRGMRVVNIGDNIRQLWDQAASEALAAFGDGRLYAEEYCDDARHIEIQVIGDGQGSVTHLWERDCSLQRRHQKIIEITPAPNLNNGLRNKLLDAAVSLAVEVKYRGIGTFEFLVDLKTSSYFFIEANPRLQVEHTITEEVLGLDLVSIQLDIASGMSLEELGLLSSPPINGTALQLRINAEEMKEDGKIASAGGRISQFQPSSGPGVRVDTAAHNLYSTHPSFDSLLAKLIIYSHGSDQEKLLIKAGRVLSEFVIEGLPNNLSLLAALVLRPEIVSGEVTTGFVEENWKTLFSESQKLCKMQLKVVVAEVKEDIIGLAPEGLAVVKAPMRGSIISIDVEIGETVSAGQQLGLLEAMKMHHEVLAEDAGVVCGVLCENHVVVDEGEHLFYLEPLASAATSAKVRKEIDLSADRSDLLEVIRGHDLGLDINRPLARKKRALRGSRMARENIEDLCDEGSFIEYGALAIAAQRRRRSLEDLQINTPADGMIAGFGSINGDHFGEEESRCAVMAYDFTVLAGTQGHNNHKKKDRIFELALEWKTPTVFFTEGGGGRPGDVDTDDLIMSWLDLKTFTNWPKLSGVAPRIAINSGRCFAGNAVIFGCSDITIATQNSNIGLAGPAMIEGGGLGSFSPDDIGPIEVQEANGVVDVVAADEHEATQITRQILGCFQGPLKEWECSDQRILRHLIPENRMRVYDIREVIRNIADKNSFIELRRKYGPGLITGFVRIEGRAMGLIANDPKHLGGAIDGEGGEKGGRFLQLCDAYQVPVLSLCDTPGFMVGPGSERTAAVRRGSRLIVAGANLSVPLFTIIIRKGYGLGAQAMAGGSFHQPFFTIAWPTAEMGPMGLEGAVELGFKKELMAAEEGPIRQALYEKLVAGLYEKGKAVSVASAFEIDAVIDPKETRSWLIRGMKTSGSAKRERKSYVDVW